jgi:hypothetical protein
MNWIFSAWKNSMVFIGFAGLVCYAVFSKGWIHTTGLIVFGLSVLLLLGEIISRMEHRDNLEYYEKEKK